MDPRIRRLSCSLVASLCLSLCLAWALRAVSAAPLASTLNYPGPGACSTTLQACIDSANDGDSISISAGSYVTSVTLGKAVSLIGTYPTTLTALPGQRVLTVTAAASNPITLAQLTLTGGSIGGDGGGLQIASSAPVYITNVTLISNTAAGLGGGMAIAVGSGPVRMQKVFFTSNTALRGGGLHIGSGDLVTITESTFRSNTASTSTGGAILNDGVLILERSPFFLFSVAFVQNHSFSGGGAIESRTGGAFGIGLLPGQNAVKFERNFTLNGNGGALLNSGALGLNGAVFISNTAPGLGGGLFSSSSFGMSGTQFVGNVAASGGGAFAGGNAVATNSLFERNVVSMTATGLGGGMAVSGTLSADATQFLSNSAGIGSGVYVTGAVSVSNSQFINNKGNQTGCQCGGGVMGVGSVSAFASTFERNSGNQASGLLAGGSLTLTDSVFLDNDGIDGAAYMQAGTANVSGGRFENNLSWVGGGLYLSNGAARVSGTQFISNAALYDGGGLFSYLPLTLTNALFMSNTAAGGNGGGVYAASALTISATRFLSNTAKSGGGLIQDNLYNRDGRIVNSLFAANRATGGGSAAADLDLRSNAYVAILHTTIADSVLNLRPAISVASGTVGITDTIVANHSVGISQTAGIVRLAYNVLFGNTIDTFQSGGSLILVSNVFTDPKFINPAANDYHLGPGSGAIDGGINAGVFTDFDGDPRPMGAGFDIGYDERLLYVYLPLLIR